MDSVEKYQYLSDQLNQLLQVIHGDLDIPPEGVLLEDSGGRGYHLWIFLNNSLAGSDALRFYAVLKSLIETPFEFFPKQGSLGPKRKLGNLIKLPLGIHQKYGARSTFFDLVDNQPHYIESLDDNLRRLETICPVSESTIRSILDTHKGVGPEVDIRLVGGNQESPPRPMYLGDISYLVSNCSALKKLTEKAKKHDAFSHSEVFHLTNILLSAKGGEETLEHSLRSSYGDAYDADLASVELEKIRPLLPTSCATMRREEICPAYCKESVRKRNEDPLQPSTTPLSVWLSRSKAASLPQIDHIPSLISSPSNIQRAYWLLKQYHEHEDSLFFDPFDFGRFEDDLEANREIVAQVLSNQESLDLSRYLPVEVPKKLDEDLRLQYRTMAYSTVYDQVALQAIFNVISPLFESRMQDSSYGYRCDVTGERANSIFSDWRENYPRFRNAVLDEIRGNPNGAYVCCDIKGYYDHINHEILNEQIASVIPDPYIQRSLRDAIDLWQARPGEAVGLPQGPAYARILANYYLNDLDTFAQSVTTRSFRYVDDFYLMFESRDAAQTGLQKIVEQLAQLGLSLSDDEDKKPDIFDNSDESRVTNALDKIQYGLMEETKYVSHMDRKHVNEFYNSVERHGGSIQKAEDIGKMNKTLSSLLYTLVQDPLEALSYRKKVFFIIDFLVENKWFYSKRLKTVFYRILELVPNNDEALLALFKKLHPTHKVYFLLSVLAHSRKPDDFGSLLRDSVAYSLTSRDIYVRGMACAIAKARSFPELEQVRDPDYLKQLFVDDSYFPLIKWFDAVRYRQLSPETKEVIRANVTSDSSELLKMGLFGCLGQFEISYLDEQFIARLLDGTSRYVIPAQSAFFASLTGKSSVFHALVEEISINVSFKQIAIDLITSRVFTKYGAGHKVELENQHELYKTIGDDQLGSALQRTLSRISDYLDTSTDFSRTHQLVDNYNECLLYKYIGTERGYSILELIPEKKTSSTNVESATDFKQFIEDLSEKAVLPPLVCEVDSTRGEFRIGYSIPENYEQLNAANFSIGDQKSILSALTLVSELYGKALYFAQQLGSAPYISYESILVDRGGKDAFFKVLGQSLQLTYVSPNNVFSANSADIPKMLGQLLVDLFYDGIIDNVHSSTDRSAQRQSR